MALRKLSKILLSGPPSYKNPVIFTYHNVVFSRKYSDAPPATNTSMPRVFERIKAVANADMVGKVNACYVFELEGGEGKYYIDLKEGEGQVGEGEVPNKPSNFKPEVKITMNKENMLKMFNSKSPFNNIRQ